ncbi:hypothetical protein L6164_011280 [Bauhinia variegata]|uniref:Uncharacterized protein n=1 Tax=Bauhinia variegata TaxID=167791 RepID=A0ACB9P660_BAUVA|nr:hypothetical protein L6164_011280 [Bauhinia variegata]
MKHKYLISCEDLASQDHKQVTEDNTLKGNISFVTREVPIHGKHNVEQCGNACSNLSGFSKGNKICCGKGVMDYDIPELVVFIQEENPQFVKDICIDKGVTTQGKCLRKDCDSYHSRKPWLVNYGDGDSESTAKTMEMETESSNSNGSECVSPHHCIKDVTKGLTMEDETEIDSEDNDSDETECSTKNRTYVTLEEIFRKGTDCSRSFNSWQSESVITANGSRMEFPQSAYCQQIPETVSMSMHDSQSLASSGTETKSRGRSRHSNDSGSSTHSFAFPILPVEWSGSPVRMAEADRGQSRKQEWRKIFVPCCKF